MKIEQGEMEVTALDKYGRDIGTQIFPSRKEAKIYAKRMIGEREMIASGMVKVEVRDDKGQCVADFFVMVS